MTTKSQSEKRLLIDLSARLGSDPFLVQASTGNTSIKIGGTLWVKSSGAWLADASHADIFTPVNLTDTLDRIHIHQQDSGDDPVFNPGHRASIETPMHAVLPHRVVIHVHSINAIAWAIRADAPDRLESLLSGMQWQWIPYVSSGVPLADAIQTRTTRKTTAIVLGNHGLIVCGETCEEAENTLREVDRRLTIPPAIPLTPNYKILTQIAEAGPWLLPDDPVLHVLGTDMSARLALAGGILYPCQSIFWHATDATLFTAIPSRKLLTGSEPELMSRPFLIVEGCGLLLRQGFDRGDYAILRGLAHVVQRIPPSAPINYLSAPELLKLTANAGNYRAVAKLAGYA